MLPSENKADENKIQIFIHVLSPSTIELAAISPPVLSSIRQRLCPLRLHEPSSCLR